MPAPFLTSIDLAQNELLNARLQNLAAAPVSPVDGQVYFDTVLNSAFCWDGNAWQPFSAGADGSVTVIATAAPAAPVAGQQWWNLGDGKLYVFTGGEWAEATNEWPQVDGTTLAVDGTGMMSATGNFHSTVTIGAASGSVLNISDLGYGSSSHVVISGSSVNGANIKLIGNGATTPSKWMRAQSGTFQILNNAYSAAILSITDGGNGQFAGQLGAVGAITSGTSTAVGQVVINGPAAINKVLRFQTASLGRWSLFADANAESGSNAGSNLIIYNYDDAGAVIGTVFSITRATGNALFAFNLSVSGQFTVGTAGAAGPVNAVVMGAAGSTRQIIFQTGTTGRWILRTTPSAESGGNAGSNFSIDAYDDAGTLLNSPLAITRSTGLVTLAAGVTTTVATIDGAASTIRQLNYTTSGSLRWFVGASSTAESGGSAGSNYVIQPYLDDGVTISALFPLKITRSNGLVSMPSGVSIGNASGVGAIDNTPIGQTTPAAGTFTVAVVGTNTAFGVAHINGPAASIRYITFDTAGVGRWSIVANNTPETGANVGSDFNIWNRDDTGAAIANPFRIARSSGLITMPNGVAISGTSTIDGAVIGGTTPAAGTFTALAATGGVVTLSNATSNRLVFANHGSGAPTFTTRSVGTKIVLWDTLTGASADYAIGIGSNGVWTGVPDSSGTFAWYCGTTQIASLSSATFTAPGLDNTPIGQTTASDGAFTSLSASGAVSGAGVAALFASPYSIGGSTPNFGTFTVATASAFVGGSGAFTSLTATSALAIAPPPAAITATTYTVGANDTALVFNPSNTCTVTLPTPGSSNGRVLWLKNLSASFALNSASSIVQPRNSATPGTALLVAGAGNYCHVVCNGTHWIVMGGT